MAVVGLHGMAVTVMAVATPIFENAVEERHMAKRLNPELGLSQPCSWMEWCIAGHASGGRFVQGQCALQRARLLLLSGRLSPDV